MHVITEAEGFILIIHYRSYLAFCHRARRSPTVSVCRIGDPGTTDRKRRL